MDTLPTPMMVEDVDQALASMSRLAPSDDAAVQRLHQLLQHAGWHQLVGQLESHAVLEGAEGIRRLVQMTYRVLGELADLYILASTPDEIDFFEQVAQEASAYRLLFESIKRVLGDYGSELRHARSVLGDLQRSIQQGRATHARAMETLRELREVDLRRYQDRIELLLQNHRAAHERTRRLGIRAKRIAMAYAAALTAPQPQPQAQAQAPPPEQLHDPAAATGLLSLLRRMGELLWLWSPPPAEVPPPPPIAINSSAADTQPPQPVVVVAVAQQEQLQWQQRQQQYRQQYEETAQGLHAAGKCMKTLELQLESVNTTLASLCDLVTEALHAADLRSVDLRPAVKVAEDSASETEAALATTGRFEQLGLRQLDGPAVNSEYEAVLPLRKTLYHPTQ